MTGTRQRKAPTRCRPFVRRRPSGAWHWSCPTCSDASWWPRSWSAALTSARHHVLEQLVREATVPPSPPVAQFLLPPVFAESLVQPFVGPINYGGRPAVAMADSTRPRDWAQPARDYLFTDAEQAADLERQRRRA